MSTALSRKALFFLRISGFLEIFSSSLSVTYIPVGVCGNFTQVLKNRSEMVDFGAQSDDSNQAQGTRLKHLEFVQVAALQAVLCLSSLYNFAKENAGPLRPGVQAVEGTVKVVVAPVYEKFQDVPLEFLKLVDRKADDIVGEVERHVPSLLKRAHEVARSVAGDVQRFGVVTTTVRLARSAKDKYSPVAQDVYGRYEPVLERYAVFTWRSINQLPVFPQISQIVVPTAAYWTEKYNKAVGSAAERGYVVADFLPFVPIERITKVFGGYGGAPMATSDGNSCSTIELLKQELQFQQHNF